MATTEKIIKSKLRVQKHGEVFTPRAIVQKMIDVPELKDFILEPTTTVLEPAIGEGVFFVEILKRRLRRIEKEYSTDIITLENQSLLALTTLYGIELLEDNAQKCVLNIYQTYLTWYAKVVQNVNKKMSNNILASAKVIITANIVQGDFLKRTTPYGNPIVFSEWKVMSKKGARTLLVERIEYTLDEIYSNDQNVKGELRKHNEVAQLDMFGMLEDDAPQKEVKLKYSKVRLVDVHKEEMEEVDEQD